MTSVEIVADQGLTVEGFFSALKEVQAGSENFYVQLLIALTEYENFVQMMV